jgi:hypothetical protein
MYYHHFGYVQVKIPTKGVHGTMSGKNLPRVDGSGRIESSW